MPSVLPPMPLLVAGFYTRSHLRTLIIIGPFLLATMPSVLPLCLIITGGWLLYTHEALHGDHGLGPMPSINPGENPAFSAVHPQFPPHHSQRALKYNNSLIQYTKLAFTCENDRRIVCLFKQLCKIPCFRDFQTFNNYLFLTIIIITIILSSSL